MHQRLETLSDLVAKRATADNLTTVTVDFSPAQAAPSLRESAASRAVAALNHPNIWHFYDVGPDYLVMEFVGGTPIASVDTTRKLLDIAVQIADGLAAAHAAGITHRELKPDNILITRDGRGRRFYPRPDAHGSRRHTWIT